jgi:hypothetical protein
LDTNKDPVELGALFPETLVHAHEGAAAQSATVLSFKYFNGVGDATIVVSKNAGKIFYLHRFIQHL